MVELPSGNGHGLWRSLVAHLTGGQGVAGSNVVNGAGGKTLYACGDRVTGSVTCFDEQYGALFLTSRPDGLFAQFVAVDGRVVDTFTLRVTN